MLLLQVGSGELMSINWDAMTIPSLMGLIIAWFVYERITLRKEVKEKERTIQELNDKRVDDTKEYSESLREINEETNDQFNKFMMSWEIFKNSNNVNR